MSSMAIMDRTATSTQSSFSESVSGETACTTEIRWPAKWLKKKLRALQGLSRLSPNWDSYGAATVAGDAIEFASRTLTTIALITTEEPAVGASPSGMPLLTLTTDSGSTVFELEFFPDGEISYALTRLHDPKSDVENRTEYLSDFVELIPGA